MLQEFDICWFFPPGSEDSSWLRSQTYIWIGDYAGRVGSFDGAHLCYKYAVKAHPFSKEAYRNYFFSVRNIQRLFACKKYVVQKLQLVRQGEKNEIR